MGQHAIRQVLLSLVFVILLISASAVMARSEPAEAAPADAGNLPPVEIRQFEGRDLSSINDFRENSIKGVQRVDVSQYTLTVTGLVEQEQSYRYDEVITGHETFRKVITLSCVEGWDVTLLWEGVLVKDLLAEAGVRPEASTVIFRSVDGYSTSFPLSYIVDNDILLAHAMNGVTLPPERGFPFQLVAESKWGYKWIKWVNEIELSDDEQFRGYWESFGYSNDGSLDAPMFEAIP